MTENHPNDAALLALSFVEALILENGKRAQTIASLVKDSPTELGEMFYVTSKVLAALLEDTLGITGAYERLDTWRQVFLNPEAAPWLE